MQALRTRSARAKVGFGAAALMRSKRPSPALSGEVSGVADVGLRNLRRQPARPGHLRGQIVQAHGMGKPLCSKAMRLSVARRRPRFDPAKRGFAEPHALVCHKVMPTGVVALLVDPVGTRGQCP